MELPKIGFVKNVTAVGVGRFVGNNIAFLVLILLARWMTKSDYGEVRYVISIATFASLIVSAGLPTTLTRFLAKHDNETEKSRYFTNTLAVFFFTLCATEIVVLIVFWPSYIYALVVLGFSIPTIYFGLLRGRMQYYKYSFATALRHLLKMILLIIVLYTLGLTFFNVLLIFGFAGWIAFIALELIRPSILKIDLKSISKKYLKKIVGFSYAIFIYNVTYALINTIPIIILERFWDFDTIAIYSTAFLIIPTLSLIPRAITTISMPKMTSMKRKEERMVVFWQSIIIIFISCVILLILAILFGKWLVILVFTRKYAESYLPLVLFSIGGVFIGISMAFSALWQSIGRPIIKTYDGIVGVIVTLIFCLLLIPSHGYMGAAFGFLVGRMSSIMVSSIFLIRLVRGKMKTDQSQKFI